DQVRIGHMFDALRLLLQPTVPSRIELLIDKPEPDITLPGNQTELQQTLLNLCLNAVQAMPAKGQLRVDAELVDLAEDFFINEEVVREGSYLRIRVSDNGTGMPQEVLDNLFQPFFTTKTDGTGL